jgi:hypothetical protein
MMVSEVVMHLPRRPLIHRLVRGAGLLAALATVGVGALLASLALEHRTGVTLPAPTGSFAVGREVDDWADEAATDAFAPAPGTRRELLAWIWYPAAAEARATTDDYLPAALRAARTATVPAIARLVTRDPSRVHEHSLRAAPLSPRESSYPVAILRAGASREVVDYTTLAEDLASHGYVVVGFDAPYRTHVVAFPDGRVVTRLPENDPERCLERPGDAGERCLDRLLSGWTADMAFALDRLQVLNQSPSGRFAGRLDLTRVGVVGHSFGGAAALQFCHDDPRCRAVVDLDGAPHGSVVQTSVAVPCLLLLSDHSGESDPASRRILADIQSIYDRAPADGRLRIVIRGANHFLFSDDGTLRSRIVLRALRAFGIVGIDGRRQLAVTAHALDRFLDASLNGETVSSLRQSVPAFPELLVVD